MLDCGRYAVKRTLGQRVEVWADIFRDGHEILRAAVKYRPAGARAWLQMPMEHHEADRWRGVFEPTSLGRWQFVIEAFVDRAASWRNELERKVEAGQKDLASELAEGAGRCSASPRWPSRRAWPTRNEGPLGGDARPRARGGRRPGARALRAWYELFPRSWAVSRVSRRRCRSLPTTVFDVSSPAPDPPDRDHEPQGQERTPWSPHRASRAVRGRSARRTAATPRSLRSSARSTTSSDSSRAAPSSASRSPSTSPIQCSPDHPWLREHPDWFEHRRPDGTLQYAENPPNDYRTSTTSTSARGLASVSGSELRPRASSSGSQHGVAIFRVDNPHTKPLAFWEWLIREVREA